MDNQTLDSLHETTYREAMASIEERDGFHGKGKSNADVYEELAASIFETESGKEAIAAIKASA
ncbi:hypothetical protein VCRA2127O344_20255 [Vibrio crassostreae]|nr:hypothetical protein VCRA2127O344_20255 [Vibrio crassostreae]